MIKKLYKTDNKNNAFIRDRRLQSKFESRYFSRFLELDLFDSLVSQKEGIVRGVFGKDSAEYLEFFPLGITEYSNSNLANVELLMSRMVNSSVKYTTQLTQAFVDQFTDIQTRFVTARASQLAKIGEVSGTKQAASARRDVLETQLMQNVLSLAKEFLGDPAMGMSFFDQSIVH